MPTGTGPRYATATLALVAAAATLVVTACGSLIPPQHVDNPLGLDGAALVVSITDDSARAAALPGLADSTGSASATGSFSDFESPIALGSFSISQPLAGEATVTGPLSEQPDTIVLSDLLLSIEISDASASTSFALTPSGSATLTKTSGNEYAVSVTSFSGDLSADALTALNPIVMTGGFNQVTATLSVTSTSTPDLPIGSSIELRFGTGEGTIGF